MLTVPSKTELINACAILFGFDSPISNEFLISLNPSALRVAYLKKSLETHPDRAKALGENEIALNERFKKVNLAYESLRSAIENNIRYILKKEKTTVSQTRRNWFSDHFYRGCLPKRELLIGQFLYYSGIVSWRTLISAIIWQKRQRPLIGQIAQNWGMLSSHEIHEILAGRSHKERFGEYAWRKGYINSFERMALVGRQRSLQRPIGEYFMKQGIISAPELQDIVESQQAHNRWAR